MVTVPKSFVIRNFPTIFILGYLSVFRACAMDINEFFPDIHGNLTKITWAHAVNNKTHLSNALNSSVMMLEADVIYGKLNGTGDSMPIMGHPPDNQSDLSLEDFLQTTYAFNKDQKNSKVKKGVKLDFKSTEVFTKSVSIVKKIYPTVDYPLWINADIINGPLNSSTVPVDATDFLTKAKDFDKSVLSLGWTTTKPGANNMYTDDQVKKMIDAIKKNDVKQNITFAVRAGIAAQSLLQMKELKAKVDNCTLTVWSSEGDDVDVAKLRDVIFEYGVERVFIDVPQDLYSRLNLGDSGAGRMQTTLAVFSVLTLLFN